MQDARLALPQVPRSCQCMLMSATTSQEVERLQALILHNPVTLNLLGGGDGPAGTARGGEAGPGPGSSPETEHYAVRCSRCCGLYGTPSCTCCLVKCCSQTA